MLKRTKLKRVGKIGRANIEANRLIREQNPPQHCEIRLDGCLGGMYLTIAHKHKRAWYKGDVELLSDYNEWVCACVSCHNQIEFSQELTDKIFKKCRP